MGRRRPIALLALVALLAALVACSDATTDRPVTGTARGDVITVGSFDFAESHLLAEIYSQALEAGGYRVKRAYDLGPREFVLPAMVGGMVDFVPEYAGTAVQFLSLGEAPAMANLAMTYDALVRTSAASHLTALGAAPAEDANAFVVTRRTAEAYGLEKLSDVAAVAGELTFGGPPECATRPLCLAGLREAYGVRFAEVVALDVGGPRTRQALRDRLVDIALLFSTDPALAGGDLVELVDDRDLQPAENVTPLVRTEVVDRWGPPFVELVDAVSARLTTDTLRVLNAQVAGDGSGIGSVATAWLAASGPRRRP